MKTLFNVILRIFLILLLAAAIVAGVLVYEYYKTDPYDIPPIEVELNDVALNYGTAVWNAPVYGGIIYKQGAVERQVENEDYSMYSPPGSKEIFFEYPKDMSVEISVTSPSGGEVTAHEEPGVWEYIAAENGTYLYTITASVLQQDAMAYGTYTFSGGVLIDVQPEIQISQTQAQQGDLISVSVTGMGELPVPTIEQDLSVAQFAKQGNGYIAHIGVAHDATPGEYPVNVTCGELVLSDIIYVSEREFGRQDLTISTTTAADTRSDDDIAEYNAAIVPLFDIADEEIHYDGMFIYPCDNLEKNTEYGIFRYTNGSSYAARHVGIDYDGEIGDNAYAVNNGRIVYADYLQVTGYTVVIEHGAGLKSYYYHLDSLNCAVDDMVQTGDIIGYVGTTGYSTGAHLHFEMRMGREPIDPEKLFEGTSEMYVN